MTQKESTETSSQIQDKFVKNTIYIVLGILLLIFLVIQPYNIFCRLKNTCSPITFSSFSFHKNGNQKTVINFVANIPDQLKQNIEFYPDQERESVLNGKNITNFYMAKNLTAQNIIVAAHFDVEPKEVEKYLERIECICFQNQPLKVGGQASMPLDFRINPKIEEDPQFKNLKEITISYKAYLVE
ncbi:MAG: cytochrome c oxidase assembly protein [Pseudomonadota bacterium]